MKKTVYHKTNNEKPLEHESNEDNNLRVISQVFATFIEWYKTISLVDYGKKKILTPTSDRETKDILLLKHKSCMIKL